MRLAVYLCCCFLVGSLNQAEHLAAALIKPIFQVIDAVVFLCLQICLVSMRDGICGQTLDFVVDIHVKWHCSSPSVSGTTIKKQDCLCVVIPSLSHGLP